MSYVVRFIRLPSHRKVLFVAAVVQLSRAWFIVRKSGFTKQAPFLGTKHAGDWTEGSIEHPDKVEDVRWAINKVCNLSGDRFTCLMIALAGKALMRRDGIPNALVLGAKISCGPEQSNVMAHAWLRAGEMVVFGSNGMSDYQPIVSYVDVAAENK